MLSIKKSEKETEENYQTNQYFAEQKLFQSIWETPTIMPEQVYREEIRKYYQKIEETRPLNIIIDASQANYTVSVETQEWMVDTFSHIYLEIKLEKLALVMSEEFITQLSLEQTLEDMGATPYQIKYFDQLEKAQEWINPSQSN